MKISVLLALLLLAGCVSYDPQANAKRLCRTAPELPYAKCVEDVYAAGLAAVPEPQPEIVVQQQRTVTCTSSRDFPGSRLLTSVTTTCN